MFFGDTENAKDLTKPLFSPLELPDYSNQITKIQNECSATVLFEESEESETWNSTNLEKTVARTNDQDLSDQFLKVWNMEAISLEKHVMLFVFSSQLK